MTDSASTLSKDAILGASDAFLEKIDVPEWGGVVYLRSMTAAERDAFEIGCTVRRGRTREQNLANVRARLCAYCLADAAGAPLFVNPEADAPALGQKSGAVLERLWARAREMNALNAEDVEELTKN